eukprot:12043801-Alexandrium_andersonii.AAC.1
MVGPRAPPSSTGSAGTGWVRTLLPRGAGLRVRAPAPQRPKRRLRRNRFRRCRGRICAIPATEPNAHAA